MLCVFIPSEGSALLSSFDFRATLSRTIFSKKSSRNASHMRTVFLIKESLFDGKVLPQRFRVGYATPQKSPLPLQRSRIEILIMFCSQLRAGNQGRYDIILPKTRFKKFYAKTDVIAQSLKNCSELCYTIRGRCFMLSMNYEKCPLIRCFSEEVQ